MTYVYYPELVDDSFWGDDGVLLNKDINLLEHTPCNSKGYGVFSCKNYSQFLQDFLQKRISTILGKEIKIEDYHSLVNEEEHKKILNQMPYKKHEFEEFSNYIEASHWLKTHEMCYFL